MTALYQRLSDVACKGLQGKAAVIDDRCTLTYEQLVSSAAAFGDRLRAAGVQPGERIGVVLGNSGAFLVAAFGIWKQGAVPVPLDPQLTQKELLKYVLDSSIRAVVTSMRNDAMVRALQDAGAPIAHAWLWRSGDEQWIHVRLPGNGARGGTRSLPDREMDLDHPAITQYSTGSTGYPKRITRSHGQLLGECLSVCGVLSVTPDDRILGVVPFFHSHGLMNAALLTLLSGATLYVGDGFFPRDVAHLIARERLCGFPAVPFMFQLLAELPERHDLSCLRFALSAGAPLAVETARAFRQTYGIEVRQLYGATETGVIAMHGEAAAAADGNTVGHPIPGVSVRVVDEDGRLLPAGTAGRVQVVSRFAASSYDNTSESGESYFAADGFFPGDLGHLSPEGELTLCGRQRGFIHVGGDKVDPGEVEAVLLQCPGVTEAVVVGLADGAAGEKIKAVLVADGVSEKQVSAHCVQRLAEFKRPRSIEFRQQLPKSPLGKVLRKYLMDEVRNEQDRYIFSPYAGFGPAREDAEAIAASRSFATVPPFLRVLLCTDGTVTRSLEAYFWEPIEVQVLAHAYIASECSYPALEIVAGHPILRRRVILRGQITRCAYAFAESIAAVSGVAADLRHKLIDEKKGIGELLREGRLETHRELLSVRRAQAREWSAHLGVAMDAAVLVRSYRICHGGRAAIQIEEVFPEARFQRA